MGVAAAAAGAAALLGVVCPSPTLCIVVGQGTDFLARAWSLDGTKWSDQSTFNPRTTNNTLIAIRCAGPTSCEAVGGYGNVNDHPLAEY